MSNSIISLHPNGEVFDASNWNYKGMLQNIKSKVAELINEEDFRIYFYYDRSGLLVQADCDANITDIDFPLYFVYTRPFLEWKKSDTIGLGRFGHVYKCEKISDTKQICAIRKYRDVYVREMLNYTLVGKHPKIMCVLDYLWKHDDFFVSYPYYENKSLRDYTNAKKILSFTEIKYFSAQIIEAVLYMHNRKMIHRDVKASVVMLDENFNIKLAGLTGAKDMSRYSEDRIAEGIQLSYSGTVRWMAPELICAEPYDYKVDTWSFGGTVVYMATGNQPYHEHEDYRALFLIGTKKENLYNRENVIDDVQKFIDWCCIGDPIQRPSFDDLAKSPMLSMAASVRAIDGRDSKVVWDMQLTYERLGLSTMALKEALGAKLGVPASNIVIYYKDRLFARDKHLEYADCIEVQYLVTNSLFEYERVQRSGGSFRSIEVLKHKQTGEMSCVRKMRNVYYETIEKFLKATDMLEGAVKRIPPHKHVASLLQVHFEEGEGFLLRQDFVDGVSMQIRVRKEGALKTSQAKKYVMQILEALEHLHAHNVGHENLRTEKIILDKKLDEIRLVEYSMNELPVPLTAAEEQSFNEMDKGREYMYGSSMRHHHIMMMMSGGGGAWMYVAPELLTGSGNSTKAADVWALGAAIVEMVGGMKAFHSRMEAMEAMYGEMMFGMGGPRGSRRGDGGSRQSPPNLKRKLDYDESKVPTDVRQFVDKCCNPDPEQRPTVHVLMQDSFFEPKNRRCFP